MSDEEEGAAAPWAGPSHHGDNQAASMSDEGGNPLAQLQSQIFELGRKHDAVMSSIANLGDAQPRSIVYIPRKKQMAPFSGEPGKDVHTVDEFIDEVERAMRARGLHGEEQLALRDQFIEGVRDSTLQRELRRLIREKPDSSLFDVREEAIMWTLEDRPRSTNVERNRNLVGGGPDEVSGKTDSTSNAQTDLTTTLQEVVKIIALQGKAIGELTNAVRELTMQNASSEKGTKGVRFKIKPRYTDDGQPICLQWKQEPSIAVSQAMRGKSKDSQDILTKERFLERAVGKCPEVDIQIGGVPLRCLLDTGSNVSTLTESFFRDHLDGEDEDALYS
ncbi:hypothetical protein VZT92_022616 [Zoarces viviparus]|uniref:Peptidase A2 domain-containing protein n=1 Tax=Zoarces viviparus TaxID=48416 RepID=A0AAW1ECD7_ZOAVI